MRLKDVGWNAAGLLVPLLIALACIPELLLRLGSERFGLLSLGWALTAISGLFDLGVGRAATQMAAADLGRGDLGGVLDLSKVAARLAMYFGLVGTVLFVLLDIAGATRWIRIVDVTPNEISIAILILAACVPFQALISVYRGLSEAQQRFASISVARVALGGANFVAPLVVALFTTHLAAIMAALLASRVLGWLLFRSIALSQLRVFEAEPGEVKATASARQRSIDLARAGGWLTVSGVISPILVQSDRFLIATAVSASAVAVYTIPFELVTQLLVVATAIATVGFPVLSSALQTHPERAAAVFNRWLGVTALVMAAICGTAAVVVPYFIPAWTQGRLPSESVQVAQVLCLGVWLNSLGVVCISMLHAKARFRATATLHLLELPFYLAALWMLLNQHGVMGAAYAWVLRVAVDSAALLWMCFRTGTERSGR